MAAERGERRLAAIFAADRVACSRLMAADAAGTLAARKSVRGQLIDPRIAAHQGRVVKTAGGGMLVEFTGVVDAARGGVEVQKVFHEVGNKRDLDYAFIGAQTSGTSKPRSRSAASRGAGRPVDTVNRIPAAGCDNGLHLNYPVKPSNNVGPAHKSRR